MQPYYSFLNAQKLPENAPFVLYKYCSIIDRSIQNLRNREVYLTSPNQFNDPLDCALTLRYDLLDSEGVRMMHLSILMRQHRCSLQKAEVMYDDMVADGIQKYFLPVVEQGKALTDAVRAKVGILCLASRNSNFLMWSHYANRHTGMCIGYNREILYDTIGAIAKVDYSSNVPTLIPNGHQNRELAISLILHKSNAWRYEQEYRCFTFRGAGVRKLPPKAIDRIVFGCLATDEDKATVQGIVNSDSGLRHVQFHQAYLIPNSFRIGIRRIVIK